MNKTQLAALVAAIAMCQRPEQPPRGQEHIHCEAPSADSGAAHILIAMMGGLGIINIKGSSQGRATCTGTLGDISAQLEAS
jgi:hypothetical protein